MGSNLKNRGALTLALVLLCLGLLAPAAGAAMQPYTLNEVLSLTGDCSTSEADEVHDPDCAGEPPEYPAPPNGPIGRFDRPNSVAVDEWGNLYVASRGTSTLEGRIDIFDKEGHFISELADPNGPSNIAVDSKGNLYVYESAGAVSGEREVVRYPPDIYNPAAGEISYDSADRTLIFSESGLFFGLAIDRSNDHLFVADHQEIREYGSVSEGSALEATIKPAGLEFSTFVAVDAQRRLLYTTTCKEANKKCVAWVFNADTHAFIEEIDGSNTAAGKFFSAQGLLSLAVDETNGHLFVGDLAAADDIYEFDAENEYSLVSEFEVPGGPLNRPMQSAVAGNPKAPDPEDLNKADNYRHLYVPRSVASGSAIAFEPPDVTAPTVSDAVAVGIAATEAELEAQVHPKQAETTYRFEYVTEAQFEDDEWESALVAGAGTLPASNKPQRVTAPLSDLSPGSAYRFRVVAENEVGEDEEEATFTTYDDVDPHPGPCANDTLRTGTSAFLPDCRAYELVTPADTNGGRLAGAGFQGDRFAMVQSRPDGQGVSFELASGALPGTEATGGFHGDTYLSSRSEAGWSTELTGPTGTQASKPKPGSISPDQAHVFWTAEGTGTAMIPGKAAAHYVRYPAGNSELIGRGSLGTDPWAVGKLITEGGTHIVFETAIGGADVPQKLEPKAPNNGVAAVYDRTSDEVTHVVSLLPGDITPSQPASYLGASPEGEGIAFAIDETLYLRKENKVTYEIDEGLISAKAFLKEGKEGLNFAGVSAGGERIFYVKDGDLEAFDTTSEDTITFADTAARVVPVNIAPQGNRAYFVSGTAIMGSGPNQAGEEPQAGAQNLYLSEGKGTPTFIATVTERDVEGIPSGTGVELDGLGLWIPALENSEAATNPSRTSTDGGVFVFQSRANLAEYDSGEDPQIYRYEAGSGALSCLSCPPTETAPTGGALLQSIGLIDVAAPLSHAGFVPNLAKDGERIFFESTEALVSADTNGARDVYEWEEEGVGSCSQAGGCVYLISGGRGDKDSYLFGHSQSGDDVFFTTNDILVAGDEATLSVYDARVGGGFPPLPDDICPNVEECRSAPTPPLALLVPPTVAQVPSGNVEPGKRKCPRGKRAVRRGGKVVCVKKKKQRKAGKRQGGRR